MLKMTIDTSSKDLQTMLDIYNASDKFGKIGCELSLVSQNHSKSEIMSFFNCSKRPIDESGKIQASISGYLNTVWKIHSHDQS